jgi:uncharacterized membrane protein
MTDATPRPDVQHAHAGTRTVSRRAANWVVFAGIVLIISGVFKIFDALWAFKYDDDLSAEVQAIVFEGDLTTYGWVWLGVGIVLVLVGIAVMSGQEWARWTGMFAAGIAAVIYLPWIYYQPYWTILSVSLAVLVIYALAMYGGQSADGTVHG